jgi:hypothetical protein
MGLHQSKVLLLLPHLTEHRLSVDLQKPGSSVSTMTTLQAGQPGFDSRQGRQIFLLATASRQALEPTQSSIQWVPGDLSYF